jgi:hypothetical protein
MTTHIRRRLESTCDLYTLNPQHIRNRTNAYRIKTPWNIHSPRRGGSIEAEIEAAMDGHTLRIIKPGLVSNSLCFHRTSHIRLV